MILRASLIAFSLIATQLFAADAPHIKLVPFAKDLTSVVAMADDGGGHLYFVDQHGKMRLLQDGHAVPEAYLDITDRVFMKGECGLLSVVFHPDFTKNGRLFVNFDTRRDGGKLETIVAEYTAKPGDTKVDPATERVIMRYDQPYENHKGGQLAFGKDGMLYIAAGDGGLGGDPHENGQSLKTRLGKIMRIDVDHKQPFEVPADNPFVKQEDALPEIWAYGLRNPWRFSFDRETGVLYCADVGQDKYEEVDIIEKGKNYGWSAKEGYHDFKPERAKGPLTDPIKEHSHEEQDRSITGGYVYRGKECPELKGMYIYGDFMSGRIWGLKWDGKQVTFSAELMHPDYRISAFGEDKDGELYVLEYNGTIYRIAQ